MSADSQFSFRIAAGMDDFEAVHRLNYRTFVEEIPQHAPNAERRLVDKFHAENTYAVCFDGDDLVGMAAGRANRPFSLDQKLPDLDAHLPPGRSVVEVRLLSVLPGYRNGIVFARLVGLLARHFRNLGHDLAVISGTLRQERLYRHLGFTPFGPVVGKGDALFQPMYLTLERFFEIEKALSPPSATVAKVLANYLPGPVGIRGEVRAAFGRDVVSHRSGAFAADFRVVKRCLLDLTGAAHVEVLLGSGTLANDAVAGQISLADAPGFVLTNGEFGDRLVDHATRWGLDFEAVATEWGRPFDWDAVRARLAGNPRAKWIWAVHGETSTGIFNDLDRLKTLAADHGAALCLDCISSIGTAPVDLRGVRFASCVGGKALASFPGLSMVFYDRPLTPAPRSLPRYLDLGLYAFEGGIPFTTSSNLLHALQTSLRRTDWNERFVRIAAASARLRDGLRAAGFQVLAPDTCAAPAVVTIVIPRDVESAAVGREFEKRGVLLSWQSGYLVKRNWIQVCLMGEWTEESLERLPAILADVCPPRTAAGAP
ncbi:MAG: aminotransferase class V-fold PLP-dependent enzyme [Planctomycetota bacterium]